MGFRRGDIFVCADFNCGFEVQVLGKPRQGGGGDRPPTCCCGTPMRKWPDLATKVDQFEDV